MVTVRKAVEADTVRYFDWANDPSVRKNAFESSPIPWEVHYNWFQQKLKAENSYLYVGEDNSAAIGQVRFDISSGIAEISYSIDVAYRGKGFGALLMKLSIQALLQEKIDIKCFLAKVKKENLPSKRIFLNLGFIEGKEKDIYLYTLKV